MAKIAWPINASAGSPSFDAAAFRQSESVFHTPHTSGASRPLGAWSGRRPNAWVTTISGLAVTIQPGSGVLDVQTPVATGAYRCSNDAVDTSITINAAHATLERIDGIYVTVDDTDVDSSGSRNWVFAYVAGTAATAGTQVPPTTPVRSLRICTVNVPHSGSGSATITMEPSYTVAAGGLLPVASSTAYPTSPYVGQEVYDLAQNACVVWNGTNWVDPSRVNFAAAAIGSTPSASTLIRSYERSFVVSASASNWSVTFATLSIPNFATGYTPFVTVGDNNIGQVNIVQASCTLSTLVGQCWTISGGAVTATVRINLRVSGA